MKRSERIRLGRRHAALTQESLAHRIGVHRSAIANWESGSSNPSGENLARLAEVLGVSYEWLATGRGEMSLEAWRDDVPALDADLAEGPHERRLLKAWRGLPAKARVLMLELVEAFPARAR
ncbi:MAG TPA: helix-turn-helix domain-containing protein [Xanthomonadaceae bacterium]|jgi:transcriptional regulator with XRE-family HTH domain|nr:helix-turn-helix domain-containing protein [Xanthomonadaceae bacterium]